MADIRRLILLFVGLLAATQSVVAAYVVISCLAAALSQRHADYRPQSSVDEETAVGERFQSLLRNPDRCYHLLRMSADELQLLVDCLAPVVESRSQLSGRIKKKLGRPHKLRDVGDRIVTCLMLLRHYDTSWGASADNNLAKSCVNTDFHFIVDCINACDHQSLSIAWPNSAEREDMGQELADLGLDGCIGFLDGTLCRSPLVCFFVVVWRCLLLCCGSCYSALLLCFIHSCLLLGGVVTG